MLAQKGKEGLQIVVSTHVIHDERLSTMCVDNGYCDSSSFDLVVLKLGAKGGKDKAASCACGGAMTLQRFRGRRMWSLESCTCAANFHAFENDTGRTNEEKPCDKDRIRVKEGVYITTDGNNKLPNACVLIAGFQVSIG